MDIFISFHFLPRAGASRASGAFAVYKGEEPEISGSIRLRLATVDNGTPLVAHLSAMVVKHGIFFWIHHVYILPPLFCLLSCLCFCVFSLFYPNSKNTWAPFPGFYLPRSKFNVWYSHSKTWCRSVTRRCGSSNVGESMCFVQTYRYGLGRSGCLCWDWQYLS